MAELTAAEIAEVLLGIRRKILRIVTIIVVVWAISFTFIANDIVMKIEDDLLPKGATTV